ncbi:MAG: outer membrane protein assembly factor, partial [Nitrospinota bacterium]
ILDIDIEVKEKPTGVIWGGLGFSSVENFIVDLAIREENLFGRGWIASLRGRASTIRTDLTARFTDPNFRDLDFSLGGDLFFRTEEFDDFDSRREGGLLRVGRALTPFVTAGVEYKLVRTQIEDIAEDASERIREADPDVLTSAVTPFIRRDSRDSRILPTRGAFSRGFITFAGGPLGADQDTYLLLAEHRQYFPIGEIFQLPVLSRLVWSYRARARYTDAYRGLLPVFERLFLGGATTVRGFGFREVGPKDPQGNAIGGHSSGLISTSLRHPLVEPAHLVLFFDAGNVWQRGNAFDVSDLRTSAGFGLRIFTPIGPIRVDVGYKLDRKGDEDEREIHFGVGTTF